MKNFACLASAFCLAFASMARAEDWPQWRGPHFNGSSMDKGLPSKWSKEDAVWKADMPGPSAGTPVIQGGHVFVSSTDKSDMTLHALCIDRKTGKVLWNKKTGDARLPDQMNATLASPSPVADANRVFFFYGEGTLTGFDHGGKELWSRSITKDYGTFAFQWTFGATPLLHGGKLYVEVLQRDVQVNGRGRPEGNQSYLLALDPARGKTLWRHIRPSDARSESLEAYSTPIPFEHQGRKEILITGGDCISGHDPETGKELWRSPSWNPAKITHWRLVPSPVTGGGVVLACAPKNAPIYAFKAGLSGTVDDSAILWKSDQKPEITADVPTPLFYDGDFFVLRQDRAVLSRVVPTTGVVKWSCPLPGNRKYEASPTGADGKIYMMNFSGDVVVVDAAKGEVLSTIPMGESGDNHIRSTVSVASGQLLIRTNTKLFCIGK